MSEFVQSVLDRLSGEGIPTVRPQLPSRFEPFALAPEPWTDAAAEQEPIADPSPSPAIVPSGPVEDRRASFSPMSPVWPTSEPAPEPLAPEAAPRLPASAISAWSPGPDLGSPRHAEPRSENRDDLFHERFDQLDRAMARLRGEGQMSLGGSSAPQAAPTLPAVDASQSPPIAAAPSIEVPHLAPGNVSSVGALSNVAESRSRVAPPLETIELPRLADPGRRSAPDQLVQERLQRLDREIARLRGTDARDRFALQPSLPSQAVLAPDRTEFSAPLHPAPPVDRDQGMSPPVSPAWPDAPRLEALTAEPSASSVTISIGRVEIRSPQPVAPAVAVRAPSRPSRVVSLDDYLRQRGGGRS